MDDECLTCTSYNKKVCNTCFFRAFYLACLVKSDDPLYEELLWEELIDGKKQS